MPLALGGKTDTAFGGGPLMLEVELVSISDGAYVGDGPILGGRSGSYGPGVALRVAGVPLTASAGELILMPANQPYAVHARTRFKMLLTMLRSV